MYSIKLDVFTKIVCLTMLIPFITLNLFAQSARCGIYEKGKSIAQHAQTDQSTCTDSGCRHFSLEGPFTPH